MKKIILFALAIVVFCAAGAFAWADKPAGKPAAKKAAADPSHSTIVEDMRIFPKDGEDAVTRFPSKILNRDLKINVIMPEGYEAAPGRYPAVYFLADEQFDRVRAQAVFGQSGFLDKAVLVTVNTAGGGDLGGFLATELLPYIDLNYKTDDLPQNRILMGMDDMAVRVLEIMSEKGGYFGNAFVILLAQTPMPALKGGLAPGSKISAAGVLGNMARLQFLLEEKGLKFIDDFILLGEPWPQGSAFEAASRGKVNLDYFLAKGSAAVKKLDVYKSAGSIAPGSEPVQMRVDIKTKGGYNIFYIPGQLKFSPPFLSWDALSAQLSAIYGATQGTVKINGLLYFHNKGFETKIKIKL